MKTKVVAKLGDVVDSALCQINDLYCICEDAVSEASGTCRAATNYIEAMADNIGYLDPGFSVDDIPSDIQELSVEFTLPHTGKKLSRRMMRDNASCMLEAALSKMEARTNEIEEDKVPISQIEELETLCGSLEDVISELGSTEWPSAFASYWKRWCIWRII